MNLDDFRYMYRGQPVARLTQDEQFLLSPIKQEGPGRDRALLLLHGFSSSPAVYRRLIPHLTHYDTVVCPVLPGHADSIEAFANTRAADWVACAEQAFTQLQQTYQTVDVMGLSLGGLLATRLANQYSIHHLYLLAPAFDLYLNPKTTLTLVRFLRALGFHRLRNKAGNLCSSDHPEISYCQLPLNSIVEILTLINSSPWQPPTGPVDVFLGRFDEVINSDKVAARFANLGNARIHWLEHSAHVLPLDQDMETIITCLQENAAC